VKLAHLSPLAQSVAAHVRALLSTHTGEFNMDECSIQDESYKQRMTLKRAADQVSAFIELPSGMQLRKRQKVTED
jgi:hypothetical protein